MGFRIHKNENNYRGKLELITSKPSTVNSSQFSFWKLILLVCLTTHTWSPVMAAEEAALIVSLKGTVDIYGAGATRWVTARIDQSLFVGDVIRTGANSKVAILLSDETLMQVNRNSRLELKEVVQNSGWGLLQSSLKSVKSIYNLLTGEIWLRNKNRDINIELNTAVVSAGIRGTEINVRINRDLSVNIAVLEGVIEASNTFGRLNASVGEEVITIPGSAPRKRLLVHAQDAVQWTLTIPRLFGPRSFPLLGTNTRSLTRELENLQTQLSAGVSQSRADQIRMGQALRDLGRSEDAIRLFEQILVSSPDDPDAITGLGWTLMDLEQYREALTIFTRSHPASLSNYIGRIVAYAGQNRLVDSRKVLDDAHSNYPAERSLSVLEAYLNLLDGELRQAQETLQASLATDKQQPLAWNLLALVSVVLGDNDLASQAAMTAVEQTPASPTTLLIQSYTQQASFKLDDATQSVRQALVLDEQNVVALVDLARLQFGSDYVEAAWDTIEVATRLKPDDYAVQELRGFILLARRNIDKAEHAFRAAIKVRPESAESYLGLSLIHMRQNKVATAMKEITKAVLLDPQRSLLLSYWAKMLHQMQRFDKALDILIHAQRLDPRDPTPLLYQAIILHDLNRPGEAIQILNKAIELNDNRGVYRSRFLLDKDLAVKNVDLSNFYRQLGLNTWAQRKAINSIKDDYMNHSGHLFYAGSLLEQEGRDYAFVSETLLARLLQPANVNTFNTFNDYTSFFEEPTLGGSITSTVGSQSTLNGDVLAFGAIPNKNLAWQTGAFHQETDGWRDTNFENLNSVAGIMKWDPSAHDGVMLAASNTRTDQGDEDFPRFEYDSPADEIERNEIKVTRIELGYHHRFSPQSDLLIYLAKLKVGGFLRDHSTFDSPFVIPSIPPIVVLTPGVLRDSVQEIDFANRWYQSQIQFMFNFKQHDFILGSALYWGNRQANVVSTSNVVIDGEPAAIGSTLPFIETSHNDLNVRYKSYYLQDTWHVSTHVTIEGAIYYDDLDNADSILGTDWNVAETNPRIGLIWSPTGMDTIRLATFRYLLPFIAARTDPTDIAGIPIFRNTAEGSINTESDIIWEHEWSTGMTSVNLFYLDKQFERRIVSNGSEITLVQDGKLKGLEIILNKMFKNFIGFTTSYKYQTVSDEILPDADRREHLLSFGLKFVNQNGLSAGVNQIYRDLDFDSDRASEHIPITDLNLEYEFPGKRSTLILSVRNLFNEHFNWTTDRFTFQGRIPERTIIATITINF